VIRIRYTRSAEDDPTEVWIDEDTRAVRADSYASLDEGQGGITRAEIKSDDLETLAKFGSGDDVFVESDDDTDVLDDTDIGSEIETRIWWRATIIGPAG
jgi:hypothetical protein